MSFTYLAYGLKIASDISLPGLAAADFPCPDLQLHTFTKPDWLDSTLNAPERLIYASEGPAGSGEPSFLLHSLGEEFFRLRYTDGAVFILDRGGTRLWGQWHEPCNVEDFTTYLVGPILGFVLRQRGITCLHASAIAIDGTAIALVGYRGAGKSTTAAAFALRGYGVLCEDVAALGERDGQFIMHSGYPRICLWKDSAAALLGSEDALPRLTPNWEKCFLSLEDQKRAFQAEPLRLSAIYIFAPRAAMPHAPFIDPLTPLQAFMELVQNTYMNFLLTRAHRATEFLFLSRLIDVVPVRRLTPHADPARMDQLCECILKDADHGASTRTNKTVRASTAIASA